MTLSRERLKSQGDAHVLVVDDTPDNAYLLCHILESSGFRTTVACNGQQALELIAIQPPDIVLLDVMMPGMDGFEVTRHIRADTMLPFIPIILVTSKSTMPDKLEGLDSGADDFLVKPINRYELLARVRGLLRLKRAQDALRAEQHKTALLYRLGRRLSSTLDLDQVLQLTIEQAAQVLGAVYGHVLMFDEQGLPWRSITAPSSLDDQLPVLRQIERIVSDSLEQQMLDGPQPLLIDIPPDGLPHIGSAIAVALCCQQRRLGVLALFHESPDAFQADQRDLLVGVTDQVCLALYNAWIYTRLRDAEAAREQMLYLLVHDMRTPLSGVINCLELLERATQPDDQNAELIEMASEACRYQNGMIGDLLDLHRAEAGQLDLEVQLVDLGEMISELLVELRSKAQQKRILVNAFITPSLITCVDQTRVKRVLDNLLRNAIKYTPYKGAIRIRTQAVEGALAQISVEDNGHPIPAEALPHTFDRFYRPQEQHSARRGAGVGLAFCRQIVTMHGGRIWAESDGQHSTRISFTLPLATDQEEVRDEQMADSDRR